MKTKPFDVEEAKEGKPFCMIYEWKPVALMERIYLGTRPDGLIVYTVKEGNGTWTTQTCVKENLRMIVEPKKCKGLLVQSCQNQVFIWEDTPYAHVALTVHHDRYKLLKEFEVEYDVE